MALFSRKPQVGGMIGYFGLSDWWLDTFSEAERGELERLSAQSSGLGGPPLLALASGSFDHILTSQRAPSRFRPTSTRRSYRSGSATRTSAPPWTSTRTSCRGCRRARRS